MSFKDYYNQKSDRNEYVSKRSKNSKNNCHKDNSHKSKVRSYEKRYDRDNYESRVIYERKDRRCYEKKLEKLVNKHKTKKVDFNDISDYNSESEDNLRESNKKFEDHNEELDIEDDKMSSKLDGDELLEYLRQRRQHILADMQIEENQTFETSVCNSAESLNEKQSKLKISEQNPSAVKNTTYVVELDQSSEESNKNNNTFDMFSDVFNIDTSKKTKCEEMHNGNHLLNDDWDDEEGYYRIALGEILDKRYSVFCLTGQGVFSNVVRARDVMNNNQEVAIKIIRNNDMMHRAGLKEVECLMKIKEIDPYDQFHCVRLIKQFMHKNHLCLVFESLEMNLRELLKKYGRNAGLNISAIRSYAKQMLLALHLIKNAEIIHADIKPDNMLVNKNKTLLKLSDLGSASHSRNNDITEYLVSRFYRAPEIMLGLNYDHNIDMWSVGTTLYELYTSQVMFPGRNNNEMLSLIMKAKGRFPKKMIKKAKFQSKHFDDQFNFLYREIDKVTNTDRIKVIRPPEPKTLNFEMFVGSKYTNSDISEVRQFRDLLDKMLQLDPSRRISINDALNHPFIKNSSKGL